MNDGANLAKGIIISTAITGMAIAITFAVLWGGWLEALDSPDWVCKVGDVDVAATWATAIKLNFWTYLIISVSGFLAIVGACIPMIRLVNSIIQSCCLGTLQVVAIIYLAVVRLNTNGSVCASTGDDPTFALIFSAGVFM